MLKDVFLSLDDLYRKRTIVFCILVAAIILVLDYVTGKHIRFPILYVLPIWMAAWWNQKRTAYALAILLPLARVGLHLPLQESELLYVVLFNTAIIALALVFYAYFIARFKASEMKVKTLEGILPICASCKKIRNEKGEYEQMEKYITEHSEVLFSHGICQECAKKLYPELKDKM